MTKMLKNILKSNMLIFIITLFGCQSRDKDISYNDLQDIQSTHKIENLNLEKSLSEILKDTINYSKCDFPILLVISKKISNKYEFCISKTDYKIFKSNRPELFNHLIGYTKYENIPVLLFGDNNKAIIKFENVDFYNVLGKMPEYGIDNPPIVYEPRMKCSE